MGSILFILSFNSPSFCDYFSGILPYFDFGFAHSSFSKCLPFPYLLFFRDDWAVFAQFICFALCMLLFRAFCHVLFAHIALNKKWKYPWSSDPPRLLKGNRPSSAEESWAAQNAVAPKYTEFCESETNCKIFK